MRKRVLVINHSMNIGGIESSLLGFLEYLTQRDCDVELVLWRRSGALLSHLPPDVPVKQLDAPRWIQLLEGFYGRLRPLPLGRILASAGLRWKARHLLDYVAFRTLKLVVGPEAITRHLPRRAGHYDVAISYCHYGVPPRYIVDKVAAVRKYMWYHHGDYGRFGVGRRNDKRYFAMFDRIVAVSDGAASAIHASFPFLSERVHVIGNPFSPTRVPRLAAEGLDDVILGDRLVIASLGRLSPEKGADVAVRAARSLKDRGIDFVWYFIGDGGEMAQLQALVAELGVQAEMHFVGARSNPFPLLRAADVFVHTSLLEAEGMVIKEAMALHMPIIASDLPPIRKQLQDGRLGMIVAVNPAAVAEAIVEMLDEDIRAEYIGRLQEVDLTPVEVYQQLDRLLGLRESSSAV